MPYIHKKIRHKTFFTFYKMRIYKNTHFVKGKKTHKQTISPPIIQLFDVYMGNYEIHSFKSSRMIK